jgi:hypothetical protein
MLSFFKAAHLRVPLAWFSRLKEKHFEKTPLYRHFYFFCFNGQSAEN